MNTLTSKDPRLTRSFLVLAGLVMLGTVLIRAPLWNIPFERDEGEYSYIAWRMDYQEQPYRDWVDQKPPGVFWVYWLALRLPFEPVWSVHFTAAIFSAVSAGALCLLARHFLSSWGAGLAGGLFGLLSATPAVQGNAANTEVFMLPPLILSLVVFLQGMSAAGRGRWGWFLLCGILTGAAALFKQVAAVNWFFLLVMCPFLAEKNERLRQTLRFAGWLTGGVLLIWGAALGYFWHTRALPEFIYNVLTHNLAYVQGMPWSYRLLHLRNAVGSLSQTELLVWLFAILGAGAWWRQGRRVEVLWLAAWAGTSVVGVSASGYYFPHYFQQLLPVLALGAAAGAVGLAESRLGGRISVRTRRLTMVLLLGLFPVLSLVPFLCEYTPEEAVAQIYPDNRFFGQMPELGRRLDEVTRPQDRVYVYGAEPELLFYARRASATRYIFLFPLFGPYADAYQRQVETAEEIARAQPAAVLYLPNNLLFGPGTVQYLTSWSRDYIHQHFEMDRLLTDDGTGRCKVIPAKGPEAAAENHDEVVGMLFVRPSPAGSAVP